MHNVSVLITRIIKVTTAMIKYFRCAIPDVEVNGTELDWNSSEVSSWIHRKEDGKYESCVMYDVYTNRSLFCHSWIYDKTYYKTSRTMDVSKFKIKRFIIKPRYLPFNLHYLPSFD